ncbi:MAG TPA: polyprenyl diphosphate synthase [Spirochaetota bacterium]|nr:MAG: Isoprenyl transferase [Spirochaetes bacterium ADurb.Bin133]HNZ26187.1 polyprenyl diphosphate synthase [Spirochaetota bacterium]HOF02128.1 polyprenyl diphosphate synthase [Spirochaetota bacterium]HOS32809.1 polyprenyl diphosphate synthase [Spirochaetota bacterium]HOS55714.1 polyprenyl diphosphate synthase [Spirochaetota bacterium]
MKSNELRHISFIMDGNGRWAKNKGLARTAGHSAGVEKAKEIVMRARELKIPYISLYTFSKENWKRSVEEVSFLMGLVTSHLEKEFDFYIKNKIRIAHVGDREELPVKVLKAIDRVEKETKDFDSITLLLALNYSGKYDILQAAKRCSENGGEFTEEVFTKYLKTSGFPDPDLIVRTGAEFRISNYFLWQAAYSEFYVSKSYWPDFTTEEMDSAIESFYNRDRRYGGVK